MTTYDHDMIRLNLEIGPQTLPLKSIGLEWPPPERLVFCGPGEPGVFREARDSDDPERVFRRRSYSQLTDEQMAGMTHVIRGAEYTYEVDDD